MPDIDNVEHYLSLLNQAEQLAMCGKFDDEEQAVAEMDELWQEMTSQEKTLVEEKLGWFPA